MPGIPLSAQLVSDAMALCPGVAGPGSTGHGSDPFDLYQLPFVAQRRYAQPQYSVVEAAPGYKRRQSTQKPSTAVPHDEDGDRDEILRPDTKSSQDEDQVVLCDEGMYYRIVDCDNAPSE
jgi:hypothetical protein